MNLAEMISKRAKDLQLATWCIPLRGKEEVLLAMKKRGFGAGFWNASGGKIKPGEEPAFAAAREALEELGIAVSNLLPVAKIEFYFVNKPEWGQRVIGYTTREWSGEPEETEEMSPKWFNYEEVPEIVNTLVGIEDKDELEEGIAPDFNKDGEEAQRKKLEQ